MAGELKTTLHKGSFRGIDFFFQTNNTSGGRKLAEHDFVYSNRRYIQDLGSFPYTFSLTIDVAETVNNYQGGGEYFIIREALLDALYKEGRGTLVHPTFGEQEVFCKPFTIREDLNNLGISQLDVEFCVAEEDVTISQVKGNRSLVLQGAVGVYNQVQNTITNGINGVSFYTAPLNNPFAYKLLGDSLGNLLSNILQSTSSFSISQGLNAVLSRLPALDTILPTASLLANWVVDVFSRISEESEANLTPEQAFAVNEAAFNTNLLEFFTVTGSGNTQLRTNFELLDNSIKTLALANMYELAVDFDFLTTDDLQNYLDLTSRYFEQLEKKAKDFTFIAELTKLRVDTRLYTQNLEQVLYKIKNIDIEGTPLEPLVYRYYGDLSLVDTIAELNNIRDYRWLPSGTYKILTL
jgi:prophage DNA circulation protein